jgi:hypothetical protein
MAIRPAGRPVLRSVTGAVLLCGTMTAAPVQAQGPPASFGCVPVEDFPDQLPLGCREAGCGVRYPILEFYDASTATWRPGAGSFRVSAPFDGADDWLSEVDQDSDRHQWYLSRFFGATAFTCDGRLLWEYGENPNLDWDCREEFDCLDEECETRVLTEVSLEWYMEWYAECPDGSCSFGIPAGSSDDISILPGGCWDRYPSWYEHLQPADLEYQDARYRLGPPRFDWNPQLFVGKVRSTGERGSVAFKVSLDVPRETPTSVDYATADGTAVAGADYVFKTGTLVFEPGELSKTVAVAIVQDLLMEPDETFHLVLTNPVGASLLVSRGTATIEDDEHALASVRLYKKLVSGCITTRGTITLTRPARAGGLTVALHTDNPHVELPASVLVEEGALSKNFRIRSSAVGVRETATIEASIPGQVAAATLTLKPMVLKDLTLSPNPVVGGNPSGGTMTLQCPAAPGDIEVTLASSNPSVANPTVSRITIPFGTQVMTFDLTTTPVTRVHSPAISATANGVKRSRPLTVNPVP